MAKNITTLNMLNAKLEKDFAAATLAKHTAPSVVLEEGEEPVSEGPIGDLYHNSKQEYINELRLALGETPFVMYCEEVDGEIVVFQDIKRKQALPK